MERRPSPCDGRGQLAALTDAGQRKLTEAAPDHARTVRAILFDSLSPELLEAFGEICRRALAQLAERDAGCEATAASNPATSTP